MAVEYTSSNGLKKEIQCLTTDRGKIFLLKGGEGVADSVHICIKNATDTYELADITL